MSKLHETFCAQPRSTPVISTDLTVRLGSLVKASRHSGAFIPLYVTRTLRNKIHISADISLNGDAVLWEEKTIHDPTELGRLDRTVVLLSRILPET